ncbi:AP-5 complex subunit mu-1 [Mizuhopecten yessoensis]|uniref:AP-5 complex subunit mu-1 n=1 Tax=Mizuhopecten yessoensis TaxID=6573 RepID=A0A210PQ43_MIZYE|nr:AP-5 complex subunit mu-1 [Mizuhopecten yessoensis]
MDDPSDMRATPRRVRFIPPTEMFILCHYTVSCLKEVPIKGSYEMRMDGKTAKLTVKLKMSERVRNNLEYCELQIPFHNRGVIGTYDATPSQGSVMVSPDRRILVWNVGQRFPSKSLSTSLDATVHFTDSKTPGAHEDAFCVGQNSYAKLFFKIPDFTHSGCQIDPKSVQVSPNVKFKLTTVQEYLTGMEYKIWNNLGDSLVSNVPHSVLAEVKES